MTATCTASPAPWRTATTTWGEQGWGLAGAGLAPGSAGQSWGGCAGRVVAPTNRGRS
jgi:hypothetical protein